MINLREFYLNYYKPDLNVKQYLKKLILSDCCTKAKKIYNIIEEIKFRFDQIDKLEEDLVNAENKEKEQVEKEIALVNEQISMLHEIWLKEIKDLDEETLSDILTNRNKYYEQEYKECLIKRGVSDLLSNETNLFSKETAYELLSLTKEEREEVLTEIYKRSDEVVYQIKKVYNLVHKQKRKEDL